MLQKSESEEHRQIKLLLANDFKKKGWKVRHIDGEGEQTDTVENNDKIGDGENKRPDIDAKDEKEKRVIRGEAKVNNGDFDSEHSITQYKLFSNKNLDGVSSWLILGVPTGTKRDMEEILDKELSGNNRKNVFVWEY